ncbi:MAG: RnfABCDGE type electron transport complex subunit D [Elusimicrobiota bacterium]
MLTVSAPPHIKSAISIHIFWMNTLIALLPAAGVCIYFYKWKALLVTATAVFSCLISSFILSPKRFKSIDISPVITGIIISLLMHEDSPLWIVALACFFSIAIGREIFGGIGLNPFNPALIGLMMSGVVMPSQSISMLYRCDGLILLALLTGAVYLFSAGGIKMHSTAGFLIMISITTLLKNPVNMFNILNSEYFLVAFFLVNDPVTVPVTKAGKFFFGTICGFLIVFTGTVYSVLVANMFTPVLDEVFRPRRLETT